MSAISNALTLVSVEYDSDSDASDREISRPPYDSNERTIGLVLNELITKVCDQTPKQINATRNTFATKRYVRCDAEIDISSDSSCSSWSLSSDSDEQNDIELNDCDHSNNNAKSLGNARKYVKTKGELTIHDLPPIENLNIKVDVQELTQIGRVTSIVDELVVIQSFRSMPALDLDSILFVRDGSPLGHVFDVFGPVVEPRYAVRFNSKQQIAERNITEDTPVYFAANYEKPVTGYVFAEQLRQMRGTDASWKHNNEPPDEIKEYSDDETERLEKSKHRAKNRHRSNHWQRSPNLSASNMVVPPNTPNSPNFNHYKNHDQFMRQNNWFSNIY